MEVKRASASNEQVQPTRHRSRIPIHNFRLRMRQTSRSSINLLAAGASGFFTLIQSGDSVPTDRADPGAWRRCLRAPWRRRAGKIVSPSSHVQVLGQPDAIAGLAQEARQRLAAHIPWLAPQVAAVELKQIESVQEGSPRAQATDRSAQPIEVRDAVGAADDALAVERHRLDVERRQRLGDRRHAVGVVVAAPGEHAHPVAVAPADEAEAVVLDLVDPLRAGRDRAAERWQARLDETERAASGSGRAPEDGSKLLRPSAGARANTAPAGASGPDVTNAIIPRLASAWTGRRAGLGLGCGPDCGFSLTAARKSRNFKGLQRRQPQLHDRRPRRACLGHWRRRVDPYPGDANERATQTEGDANNP